MPTVIIDISLSSISDLKVFVDFVAICREGLVSIPIWIQDVLHSLGTLHN